MTTDDSVVWVDALPARNSSNAGKWVKVLEPLMTRPGHWALVRTYAGAQASTAAAATAANLHRGRVQRPPGKWEFVSRTVDGVHGLYARYLGP